MTESYKILYQGGTGEIVEKKSRFIAISQPVQNEEEAQAFIGEIKKKYWDARHHCFAYVIGEAGQILRCSDDGEPAQTAGRPILDVLLGAEVRNVCLVVTRYFGGVLLGTGGLVRAYSAAAQEGLKASVVAEKILGQKIIVSADYAGLGKLQYLAAQSRIPVLDTRYTDKVELILLSPLSQSEKLQQQIMEKMNGKATICCEDPLYFGIVDGEPLLFED